MLICIPFVFRLNTNCIQAVYNLYSGCIQTVFGRNTSCIRPGYEVYTVLILREPVETSYTIKYIKISYNIKSHA